MTEMNETEYKTKHNIKTAAGILLLLASPFAMYVIFEGLTGNLSRIRGQSLFWNLFLYALLYLAVFGITGSSRITCTSLNILLTIAALAEHYVVEFRSRPILLWDVAAFRTAMTVAGGYQYDITRRVIVGVAGIAAFTILIWFFPIRRKRRGPVRVLGESAASAALAALGIAAFYRIGIPAADLEINLWEPLGSYESQGYLASTLCSFTYMQVDEPDDYSLAAVNEIREEIEESRGTDTLPFAGDTDIVPTNIICIMNESFSDLRRVADFETDVPFLSYLDSLTENCVKGDLYMPVFGSMTCNSEFEFLTGNSLAFAPSGSVPFQSYMRTPSYSIVSSVKAAGYRTVGIHPNERTNWNREGAYRALGFDEFYGIESFDLETIPYVRGLPADLADYQKIIGMTEEKEEGEPLFIFDVTMQNHGGYEEPWEATVHLTDMEHYPKVEQYLSLVRESDAALEYLIDYYSGIDEPTMIVLFGDHQPAVEEEFYETLYGTPLVEQEYQALIRRFITPFLIWTNYPSKSMDGVSMSAQFLSTAALERANLPLTDYQAYLNEIVQVTPVVHFYGYMKNDGVLVDWSGWRENPEYDMYKKFAILQYNNMFDKKRVDAVFTNTAGE